MNLAFDLQNYLINKMNLTEYEELLVELNSQVTAILNSQPEIIEYQETEQISGLYTRYESVLNNKSKLVEEQETLTRKINKILNECFKGKSVVVKTEIGREEEFYVIHPSMFEDELTYEFH